MAYKQEIFSEFTEETTKYMFPRSPQHISETEAFIQSSIQELKDGVDLKLVILKQETNEFLGCAGVHNLTGKTPELGIWLKKTAHGNKYGLEAVTEIKNWAEANLDYDYLRYPVDKANMPSRKIPETLGGRVTEEYDKKNMNGNVLHFVEYRIYKDGNG